MTITLTGYGGVGEIGGNAFLLEAPGLRAMLDIGKRFGSTTTMTSVGERKVFDPAAFDRRPGFGDYFDGFQNVRPSRAVSDLGSLGLIPWGGRLPTLYRPDLGGAAQTQAPIDLVLLSHAHVDHCGLLGLVRPDIPVAASPQTLATLGSIEATGMTSWETDYTDVRVRGGLEAKPDGSYGRLTYREGEAGFTRRFVTDGRIPEHGRWSIAFHQVDHSIQGAVGFVLTDGDTKIVYTGDFRQHGLRPERTREFLKAAAEPDVLIIEGTRVGDAHRHEGTDRERDVEDQAAAFLEDHAAAGPPFVGVGYPPRDIDRLRSLHRVARRAGRRLLLTTKQAHLLDALRGAGTDDLPAWRTDPNLAVYLGSSPLLRSPGRVPVASKERLAVDHFDVGADAWSRLASRELERWEFALLGGRDEKVGAKRVVLDPVPFGADHVASASDVAADPGAYLMSLNLWNMTDLLDVFPDRARAGGLYIHSQTQPHNDDMELDQFRLRRWLRAFHLNAPDHEPRRTHVSGHASQDDLDAIIDELRPKLLVPIHNERPDLSRDRFEARTGRKALVPRWGNPETLVP